MIKATHINRIPWSVIYQMQWLYLNCFIFYMYLSFQCFCVFLFSVIGSFWYDGLGEWDGEEGKRECGKNNEEGEEEEKRGRVEVKDKKKKGRNRREEGRDGKEEEEKVRHKRTRRWEREGKSGRVRKREGMGRNKRRKRRQANGRREARMRPRRPPRGAPLEGPHETLPAAEEALGGVAGVIARPELPYAPGLCQIMRGCHKTCRGNSVTRHVISFSTAKVF